MTREKDHLRCFLGLNLHAAMAIWILVRTNGAGKKVGESLTFRGRLRRVSKRTIPLVESSPHEIGANQLVG